MDDELGAATSSTTTTCNCNCGSSNGSDDNDSKPNWIEMSGILFAAVTVLGSIVTFFIQRNKDRQGVIEQNAKECANNDRQLALDRVRIQIRDFVGPVHRLYKTMNTIMCQYCHSTGHGMQHFLFAMERKQGRCWMKLFRDDFLQELLITTNERNTTPTSTTRINNAEIRESNIGNVSALSSSSNNNSERVEVGVGVVLNDTNTLERYTNFIIRQLQPIYTSIRNLILRHGSDLADMPSQEEWLIRHPDRRTVLSPITKSVNIFTIFDSFTAWTYEFDDIIQSWPLLNNNNNNDDDDDDDDDDNNNETSDNDANNHNMMLQPETVVNWFCLNDLIDLLYDNAKEKERKYNKHVSVHSNKLENQDIASQLFSLQQQHGSSKSN